VSTYLAGQATQAAEWRRTTANEFPHPGFTPTRIAVVDESLELINSSISAGRRIGIVIEGEVQRIDPMVTIGFCIYANSGETLWWSLHTDGTPESWPTLQTGHNRLLAWLPGQLLNEGGYRVELVALVHFAEWITQPLVTAPSVNFEIHGGLSESPYWLHARPGILAPTLRFEKL
jgi:lipopolysaccharide transport system ATP-binding protein